MKMTLKWQFKTTGFLAFLISSAGISAGLHTVPQSDSKPRTTQEACRAGAQASAESNGKRMEGCYFLSKEEETCSQTCGSKNMSFFPEAANISQATCRALLTSYVAEVPQNIPIQSDGIDGPSKERECVLYKQRKNLNRQDDYYVAAHYYLETGKTPPLGLSPKRDDTRAWRICACQPST